MSGRAVRFLITLLLAILLPAHAPYYVLPALAAVVCFLGFLYSDDEAFLAVGTGLWCALAGGVSVLGVSVVAHYSVGSLQVDWPLGLGVLGRTLRLGVCFSVFGVLTLILAIGRHWRSNYALQRTG